MRCSACDAAHDLAAGERVGFRDACRACGADLHSCRNCNLHDPAAHNQCRESNAEWVSERERANRCEDFEPGNRAGGAPARATARAKSELDALFRK